MSNKFKETKNNFKRIIKKIDGFIYEIGEKIL
ncbi:hypothetical protein ARAQ110984_04775 [Arcobacter aquimarinus]